VSLPVIIANQYKVVVTAPTPIITAKATLTIVLINSFWLFLRVASKSLKAAFFSISIASLSFCDLSNSICKFFDIDEGETEEITEIDDSDEPKLLTDIDMSVNYLLEDDSKICDIKKESDTKTPEDIKIEPELPKTESPDFNKLFPLFR
jgi:hypothetical protein